MSTRTILGVSYFSGSAIEAVKVGLSGGRVVIPSAPVIVRMEEEEAHRQAVLNADLTLPDSGLMVLLWRLFTGERLNRISGLEYLKLFLGEESLRRPGAVAWVMPSALSRDNNLEWLGSTGHPTTVEDCYLAPQYPAEGDLRDPVLLGWLRERRPQHLIIALGGGVQERLGLYLKDEYGGALGIHCVGAAIGFLSGEQVNIPAWADRYFLGWFFRCWSEPSRYVPRYYKAARLVTLLWRYRAELPPLRSK